MFVHLIPLEELKRHSVTYWRPGRDNSASADTWVVLSERESGYETTVVDLSVASDKPEAVLALVRRAKEERAH
jgi:hypothetical protein